MSNNFIILFSPVYFYLSGSQASRIVVQLESNGWVGVGNDLNGEMEFLWNKYLKVNDSNIFKSQNVSLIISIFNQHMNDEHEDEKLPCSECDRYWTCQIL